MTGHFWPTRDVEDSIRSLKENVIEISKDNQTLEMSLMMNQWESDNEDKDNDDIENNADL